MLIQNLCGFSLLSCACFFCRFRFQPSNCKGERFLAVARKCLGSVARRGGGTRACCTHFLATDTPGSQARHQHRQECASSTPGGGCLPDSAWQRWEGGGADSPPGKGRAHLAGISSFISSPINSQIGCHRRLSIHHFGGEGSFGPGPHTPQDYPWEQLSAHSNSGAPTCVTYG